MGRDYLPTAFKISHPGAKIKTENSFKVVVSRWWNSDLCKAFRQEIEASLADIKTHGKCNDLTTRQGIVSELITSVKATQGKDAIGGLTTLAKLQGFDKPEEHEETERRKFVLTWPSHCRTCALMQLYLELKKESK